MIPWLLVTFLSLYVHKLKKSLRQTENEESTSSGALGGGGRQHSSGSQDTEITRSFFDNDNDDYHKMN